MEMHPPSEGRAAETVVMPDLIKIWEDVRAEKMERFPAYVLKDPENRRALFRLAIEDTKRLKGLYPAHPDFRERKLDGALDWYYHGSPSKAFDDTGYLDRKSKSYDPQLVKTPWLVMSRLRDGFWKDPANVERAVLWCIRSVRMETRWEQTYPDEKYFRAKGLEYLVKEESGLYNLFKKVGCVDSESKNYDSELARRPWKLIKVSKGHWDEKVNRLKALGELSQEKHRALHKRDFRLESLRGLLNCKAYNGSVRKAREELEEYKQMVADACQKGSHPYVLHEHVLFPWRITDPPFSFWDYSPNRIRALVWLERKAGYGLKEDKFADNGLEGLLKYYDDSTKRARDELQEYKENLIGEWDQARLGRGKSIRSLLTLWENRVLLTVALVEEGIERWAQRGSGSFKYPGRGTFKKAKLEAIIEHCCGSPYLAYKEAGYTDPDSIRCNPTLTKRPWDVSNATIPDEFWNNQDNVVRASMEILSDPERENKNLYNSYKHGRSLRGLTGVYETTALVDMVTGQTTNIGELEAGARNVAVKGTVVEVGEPRIIETSFGRPKRVARAIIEDDTGRIKLSLWENDIDKFKAGNKISISGAYVAEWRGKLYLNLSWKHGKVNVFDEKQDSALHA